MEKNKVKDMEDWFSIEYDKRILKYSLFLFFLKNLVNSSWNGKNIKYW